MGHKTLTTFRAGVLALLLMIGALGVAPSGVFAATAAAQTDATQPAEDDDDGFDDWGLLGLLGLAGLAGLLKRPTRDVVVDNTTGRAGPVRH